MPTSFMPTVVRHCMAGQQTAHHCGDRDIAGSEKKLKNGWESMPMRSISSGFRPEQFRDVPENYSYPGHPQRFFAARFLAR